MNVELLSLVTSKYNKVYFSDQIPDIEYLIFSNENDQFLIKDELIRLKKNMFQGFIKKNNEDIIDKYKNRCIPLDQIEGFIESGASIILTADMFMTIIQYYGSAKIEDWSDQIFFAKISNWILSQGVFDIYRNNVVRWAYEKASSESPKTIETILTLFLVLYGPKSLNKPERIASLANYDKYQLENGRIACIYNSASNLLFGWLFYREAITQDLTKNSISLPHPFWTGQDFREKRIVFRRVHGPSDEILYANIFNDLIKDNCNVIIETDKRLVDLFTRSFPYAEVIPRLDHEPHPRLLKNDIDFQANYSDPFEIYRDNLKKFPNHNGYLIPDSAKVEHWKTYFNNLFGDNIRVGISWTSMSSDPKVRDFTTCLEQWEPILNISGVTFINLQYGAITEEVKEKAPFLNLVDNIDLYNDLDELAALIGGLDLVISIDNINSNIAGGVGTPLWEILPLYWHLLLGQKFHPFYPNAYMIGMTDEDLIEPSEQLIKIINKTSSLHGENKHNKFREMSRLLETT